LKQRYDFWSRSGEPDLFQELPAKLTRSQAALITATIPNPKRFSAKRPSGYILRRQSWILGQMNSLGGTSYLKIFDYDDIFKRKQLTFCFYRVKLFPA